MVTEYTVKATGGLTLPPGTAIKLTEHQLGLRRHQVRPAKGRRGFVVSGAALMFKRGEVIEIDGELPKHLAALTDKPAPTAAPTLNNIQADARERRDLAAAA